MGLKPISLKRLIIYIAVTLGFGLIGVILGGSTKFYGDITKPPLSPPAAVFPIVWTILYILLGIAIYLIVVEKPGDIENILKVYWIQLAVNAIWPAFFWRFNAYTISSILIIIMLVLTAWLILKSTKINKTSAYLFTVYALWLLFALYLNVGIAIKN